MAKLQQVNFRCNWDESRECTNDLLCIGCEYQPKDEDKPNYHNPPKKPTEYSYGMPMCPSCGEPPYSGERCIFCGQAIIMPEEERRVEIIGGHTDSESGYIECDKCGGNSFRLFCHSDGADFYSFSYSCKECGNDVTVKYYR